MARVAIEHLTKVYAGPDGRAVRAVQDLSLVVEPGELLVLVGPSGSGKTTLLRLVAGLEQPTEGVISIDGRVVNELPAGERDLAMVFQSPALYPHLTAGENLALGLRLRRQPRAEIERRVKAAAAALELGGFLERLPAELSGGQCQRVALGRALVRQPKVLLLDEPLSHLDAPMRAQLRLELSRLHARAGATMLYVTHDQDEAMALGERIAVLREGAVEQIGAPLDLYQRPANLFVAQFIGAPPMNFVRGRLVPRDGRAWFTAGSEAVASGSGAVTFRLDDASAAGAEAWLGKEVILGLRPEHVQVGSLPPPASAGWRGRAVVDGIEPTGPETILRLSAAGLALCARAGSERPFQLQEQVEVACEARHARFFDPATSKAILCAS